MTGVGLHSGKKVSMTLRPALPNAGIVFVRKDISPPVSIHSSASLVHDTLLCTALVNQGGVRVATVEHLMAALHAMGIDNLVIELDAAEVPVLDGSAHPFLYLLLTAGVAEQSALKKFIQVKQTVRVEDGDKWAELSPIYGSHSGLQLSLDIDFKHPLIANSNQSCSVELTAKNFARELSRARTFGFMKDIEALRNSNLALGGSLDNAIVMDEYKLLNPEGLRFEDEFVRHKLLDAIGDLYMNGNSIIGSFRAYKTGHALNNKLIRTLLQEKSSWEYKTFDAPAQESGAYSLDGLVLA